jgi:hypothetical protein
MRGQKDTQMKFYKSVQTSASQPAGVRNEGDKRK